VVLHGCISQACGESIFNAEVAAALFIAANEMTLPAMQCRRAVVTPASVARITPRSVTGLI